MSVEGVATASKAAGGELRTSLRIYRATKHLDCDITLRSRFKTARMRAGDAFKMYSLLMLLETHGDALAFEGNGPDADHARECVEAIMRGERTKLTPDDRVFLKDQGRFRGIVLSDLPPVASARWITWLKQDHARKLPWNDEPTPPEHRARYPHTQARGGMSASEIARETRSLPDGIRSKVATMDIQRREEFLCSPEPVRRKMLESSASLPA